MATTGNLRGNRHRHLIFCALAILLGLSLSRAQAAAGDTSHTHLIAHWTFDETSGPTSADTSGNQYHAIQKDLNLNGLERVTGVFGHALHFSGQHALKIAGKMNLSDLEEITVSAWVMPVAFTAYNEIFRKEDGDHRLLFSFQHNGSVLSLGVHVAGRGYQELDAPINATGIMDGQWHHVAGVFDGTLMKVYLDGQAIGTLDIPGRIVTGGRAPAYIGSSGGGGEFFQGAIDDLKIWGRAIKAEQIVASYARGLQVTLARVKTQQKQLKRVYVEASTFAETLASTRQNLQPLTLQLTRESGRDLKTLLLARFKTQ
ncbi:MAG: LamG domain-containing protein, partial [Phycisphaeraceae bacterium]|nr:LamG domain-containing protein [Phycisphaeraceae bacterium]